MGYTTFSKLPFSKVTQWGFLLVLGQGLADHVFLVSLPSGVATVAQESGDVNTVDVLRAVGITAQVKLCQQVLCHLLLQKQSEVSRAIDFEMYCYCFTNHSNDREVSD